MPDDDKTFSGSLVLHLRIWWRHVHTPISFGFMALDWKVLNFEWHVV